MVQPLPNKFKLLGFGFVFTVITNVFLHQHLTFSTSTSSSDSTNLPIPDETDGISKQISSSSSSGPKQSPPSNSITSLILPTNAEDRTSSSSSIGSSNPEPYNKTKYKYVPPSKDLEHNIWNESFATTTCGPSPYFDTFFSGSINFHSRYNEDLILFNKLFNTTTDIKNTSDNDNTTTIPSAITKGTFVELGAFDGLRESNSNFFETCLGWTGLLIEASRKSYEKLVQNRPKAHRMSFAPSCKEEGVIGFHSYPLTNAGVVNYTTHYKHSIDVPCGPLTPVLLDLFEDGHINFFSLDVEGSEYSVLETMDLSVLQIDVFMIEVINHFCKRDDKDCEVRNLVRKKMEHAGYKRYERIVRGSDIYIHPKSQYQFDS